MNEGKENNIFLSWWWSQKNYCYLFVVVFSPLYLSTLGIIHIVK